MNILKALYRFVHALCAVFSLFLLIVYATIGFMFVMDIDPIYTAPFFVCGFVLAFDALISPRTKKNGKTEEEV